jgi:ABC-type Mn2+/Zn2+ transport system ATPase subunit
MNDPRGSIWRKWDLQVQTILDDGYISLSTYYNNLKSEDSGKWEEYVNKIGGEENALKYDSKDYFFGNADDEKTRCLNYVRNLFAFISTYNPEVGLIGITDHNYQHNSLIDAFSEYSSRNNDLKVICGVEVNASGVHILALFGTVPYAKSTMSKGIETFLSSIGVHNPKTNGLLSVSEKSVTDVLKEIIAQKGLYIFPHCNSDNGLFQERGRTDRTYLSDIYNWKSTILLQSRNKRDIEAVANYIQSKNNTLCATPVFTNSNDSRCLRNICAPDSEGNFTWIKADPTFEGLKQIVFENKERVSIQNIDPVKGYPKPYFSEIIIQDTEIFGDGGVKFNAKELLLNPNLLAIIGGRGTGKSLLLDAIAKTFNKTRKNKRADKISIANNDFQIAYKKQDNTEVIYNVQDSNNLDYLHIHQGEVKDIADPENPEKLDAEIKSLLKLPSYDEVQTDFPDSTIEKLINEIFDIKDWLKFRDDDGNLSNSPEFNKRRKKEKEDLIGTITTEENKQLIQKYIQNLNKINDASQHIIKAKTTSDGLSDFQNAYNEDITTLNELIEEEGEKIPAIDFKSQTDALKLFVESKEGEIEVLKDTNIEIEKSFEESGIKGDISTLLEQLEIYQRDINILNKKIEEAELKQNELNQKLTKIGEIADSIESSQQSYISTIESKWQQLKQGKEDWNEEQKELIYELLREIEIEAEERFTPRAFYDFISDYLNLQKFRQTQAQSRNDRLLETFNINDQVSFKRLLKGEKIVSVNGDEKIGLADLLDSDFFVRDGSREFLRVCLLSRYREKFWKVLSSSKYKGKVIYQLSVGQRGTFYVCLKLATDPFLKPFVFDQPEDDLDNDFIMHHLVPIFKKIKKYRQVIIVTHNANLVVNADAEQVIIAVNEDETLNYDSGGIENVAIRDQICNILEGGKDAFTKREQKYGFVNI